MPPNTTSGAFIYLFWQHENYVFFVVAKQYKEGLYLFELVTRVFFYIFDGSLAS